MEVCISVDGIRTDTVFTWNFAIDQRWAKYSLWARSGPPRGFILPVAGPSAPPSLCICGTCGWFQGAVGLKWCGSWTCFLPAPSADPAPLSRHPGPSTHTHRWGCWTEQVNRVSRETGLRPMWAVCSQLGGWNGMGPWGVG